MAKEILDDEKADKLRVVMTESSNRLSARQPMKMRFLALWTIRDILGPEGRKTVGS